MNGSGAVTILLADDDADIRDLVHFKLTGAGFAVHAVNDGTAAWTAMQTEQPDLVVLDVQMPGLSGVEVLRRIRDTNNPVPVVLLSARSRDSDVDAGMAAGATDYLIKPFSPRELLRRIQALAPTAPASDANPGPGNVTAAPTATTTTVGV